MKKLVILSTLISILLFSGSVSAQVKVGVGVGLVEPLSSAISNSLGGLGSGSDVLIPIRINDNILIEPKIGFFTVSGLDLFKIGVNGAFYLDVESAVSPYLGGSIAYSRTDIGANDLDLFNFGVGVGGEYFWHEDASIGGEVGVSLVHMDAGDSETGIGTYAKLVLRWYLF